MEKVADSAGCGEGGLAIPNVNWGQAMGRIDYFMRSIDRRSVELKKVVGDRWEMGGYGLGLFTDFRQVF